MGKKSANNRANQMNPNNPAYSSSREHSSGTVPAEKASLDNRANQLNPQHPSYHSSRESESTSPQQPIKTTE